MTVIIALMSRPILVVQFVAGNSPAPPGWTVNVREMEFLFQ